MKTISKRRAREPDQTYIQDEDGSMAPETDPELDKPIEEYLATKALIAESRDRVKNLRKEIAMAMIDKDVDIYVYHVNDQVFTCYLTHEDKVSIRKAKEDDFGN